MIYLEVRPLSKKEEMGREKTPFENQKESFLMALFGYYLPFLRRRRSAPAVLRQMMMSSQSDQFSI